MMEAANRQEVKPRRKLCWASLITGLVLAAIAVAAMSVDLSNNWHYGSSISHELGMVMVLAAIGVTALPAAAALLGWDWLLRLGAVASVLLTVWAAISAYAEKQGAEILHRQANQSTYEAAQIDAEAARQEIGLARTEAARISETLTAKALEAMAQEKQAAADRESARGGCGSKCENMKADATQLLARLGQARAKEAALQRVADAQKRLDAAKVEAKTGPAEASMLATVIAGQTGGEAQDIARSIALGTTAFAIIVTILMAGLAHQATTLMMRGLGMVPGQTAQEALGTAKTTEDMVAGTVSKQTPKAAPRVRKPLTAEERIERFIAEHVKQGDQGEVSAGDLYEAFRTWWVCHAPSQPLPTQRAIGLAMTSKGFGRSKRGGVTRYESLKLVPVGAN